QALARQRIRLERARLLPDITLGYSHQLLLRGFNPAHIDRAYFPGTRIGGVEVGVAVPLFYGAGKARIRSEQIGLQVAAQRLAYTEQTLQNQYQQAFQDYLKYKASIDYYRSEGLAQLNEQLRVSQAAFSLGEIGYIEFFQNITLATQSKLQYLSTVNAYNQTIIQLNYLKAE
ncbi:MAG TPA: TolC family protein, partial [Chitinophaga sp.]